MNNPPAFPTGTGVTPYNPGMTLRDYFAAKALPAILEQMFLNKPSDDAIDSAISSCYFFADLMLKRREK